MEVDKLSKDEPQTERSAIINVLVAMENVSLRPHETESVSLEAEQQTISIEVVNGTLCLCQMSENDHLSPPEYLQSMIVFLPDGKLPSYLRSQITSLSADSFECERTYSKYQSTREIRQSSSSNSKSRPLKLPQSITIPSDRLLSESLYALTSDIKHLHFQNFFSVEDDSTLSVPVVRTKLSVGLKFNENAKLPDVCFDRKISGKLIELETVVSELRWWFKEFIGIEFL
ncbi:hypothetical protein HK096_011210, partial [Nowakowskiella sp. JEL0078]